MKKRYLPISKFSASLLFFIMISINIFSQVGIGTVTPSASAVLELASTTQGMLTPRMTTAQRLAIVSPADGLLVNDTDLKSFYYYISTTTTWTQLSSEANGRTNFKRIKAASDLATELSNGGGSKYLLTTNTYYEINGTISLSFPVDLNEAYISGLDANEDRLIRGSGNLFEGSKGGTIRNVTIVVPGGKVFNLSASSGPTDNLLLRDAIIANCSDVGTITNFSLVFASVVQYVGNTTGIVYSNITRLLLNNTGWFTGNNGTFEKLVGTFGLVQKLGGFMEVSATAVGGFDVSANPTITNDAVMESVVFSGPNATAYVKGYSPATYTGYNFNNRWNVRSAGIPTETDLTAVGDINFDYTVSTGFTTVLTTTPVKLLGTSTSNELFRFSRGGVDNRLVYLGSKKRFFRVGGSISFQTTADNTTFVFYIAKNGAVINKSKVYVRSNSTVDVLALPIPTIVELLTTDFVEVFAARVNGSGDVKIASINLSVN